MPPDKPAASGKNPPTADERLRKIRDTIEEVDVARKALLEDRRDGTTLPAASRRRRRGYRPG